MYCTVCISYIFIYRPVKGDALVIKQLRGQLNDAQKLIQQMRTQLLAAEEDAQLHAQDVRTVISCCTVVLGYKF